jgi:MYXO-CTERM domain-containing protein
MRVSARGLALAAASAGLLSSGAAHADLTGDFADALDLDSSYLTGANGATDIAFAADGRAVVTSKEGSITIRKTDGTKRVITGTFPDLDTGSEKGLTGIARDPRAGNAFFFYADNGPSSSDKHQVYHGVLASDDTLTVDLENPIVAAGVNAQDEGLEGPANHDGGGLYVYQNHLYVAVGDTGANATPPTNKYSSCLNKGNGKILRVNLDGTIPSDNPLVGESMVTACDSTGDDWGMAPPDQRIFAWGFRNPWRLWVDEHTGRMWIGDVGETTREEVSVSAPAAGYTGQHFGYPFHEGTTDWSMDGGDLRLDKTCDDGFSPSRPCVEPVTDYGHVDGANCVTGGLIPEGCGWDGAFGGKLYYFFADFGAGWIHALEVKSDRSGVTSKAAIDVGTPGSAGPVAIRQGPGGAVYVVNNKEGSVYELKPKDQTGDECLSMGGNGGDGGDGGNGGESGGGNGGSPGGTAGQPSGGSNSSGSGGKGGSAGKGGTGGAGGVTTGGASGKPSGGRAGAGGKKAKPASSDESSGCGCRVTSDSDGNWAALLGGLGLAAFALRRRRR